MYIWIDTFWIDDSTRQPWADDELFSIRYSIHWTTTYLDTRPRHLLALAYQGNSSHISHRWWEELCEFIPFLVEYNALDDLLRDE